MIVSFAMKTPFPRFSNSAGSSELPSLMMNSFSRSSTSHGQTESRKRSAARVWLRSKRSLVDGMVSFIIYLLSTDFRAVADIIHYIIWQMINQCDTISMMLIIRLRRTDNVYETWTRTENWKYDMVENGWGKIISKKFEKPLDKSRQVWYTIIAVSESEAVKSSQEHRKRISRIFEKPLDKRLKIWYNIKVASRTEARASGRSSKKT